MRLTATLGTLLLFSWTCAGSVHSVRAAAIWQSPQSQENSQNSSAPQNSTGKSPTDQPNAPEQSAAPPQPAATAPSPCPDNPQTGASLQPDCKPTESTGTKTRKHHRNHKALAPEGTPADTGPAKTVVRNGGTADPSADLSPRLNQQQAAHQTEKTNQLLAASDANLKKLSGRQLSANQQDAMKQIKNYMQQAKLAANDGDVHRAYNLALKANLLSAELVRH